MKEIYLDIPGYEGYKVSNLGNVKSYLTNKEGRILSPRRDKDGYLMVWTKQNSAARIHRLLLMAFDQEGYFDNAVVNHINGIKDDNRRENLEWVTISDNTKHAYENGLSFSAASENIGVYYKDKMISCFRSINQLADHCGLNRNSISKAISTNDSIFDELYVKKIEELNHDVLDREFCFTKMNRYQSSPISYGGSLFESIKDLSNALGVSRDTVRWAIKKSLPLDDIDLLPISRFHYISQGNFND